MSTTTATVEKPLGASGLSTAMEHRIRRAQRVNSLMTGVFSSIGGFFLALIIALAAYIIIKGFMSFQPEFLSTKGDGILIGCRQ